MDFSQDYFPQRERPKPPTSLRPQDAPSSDDDILEEVFFDKKDLDDFLS